eukprot:CAMPEP_0172702446 /NCGR_PEP_ID=MMETSP1074-20121228/34409_1 /TAXON_ID=2916 /ORGANISM="Ceratium fusus, Strain PA161109" /LENGTH=54 /DNA_ID=CAMNT_0013524145 /DNA_START=99 /DNA_END=260 /DNA_ORIENTATION=+
MAACSSIVFDNYHAFLEDMLKDGPASLLGNQDHAYVLEAGGEAQPPRNLKWLEP